MKNLPPNLTPEIFNKFVTHTWNRSALFSYKAYLLAGRGLVLWEWIYQKFSLTISGYMTKEQIEFRKFDPHCIAMVERYNPEETFVLGIRWQVSDGLYKTGFYLLESQNLPTPIQVYNQSIQN